MKKLFLIPLLILGLNGSCLKTSESDKKLVKDSNQCLNAFDLESSYSITTKISGQIFLLKFKNKCPEIENVKISLYANDENITSSKFFLPILPFEVNNTFKNVKVRFDYDKDEVEFVSNEVECPITLNSFKKVKEITDDLESGLYYIYSSTEPYYRCYNVTLKKETSHYIEYSTDNFAIRPKKFLIEIPEKIKQSTLDLLNAYALNDDNDIVDYNSSGTSYEISFNKPIKIQYNFYLVNGKGTFRAHFNSAENDVVMALKECKNEFAKIDEDDTNNECRMTSFVSDEFDISAGSKGWSGMGTGEKENDPSKNSIEVDIRQNVMKDLRFQRVDY